MSTRKNTVEAEATNNVLSEEMKRHLNSLLCHLVDEGYSNLSSLETLLLIGADPNAMVGKENAIEIASRRGNVKTVELLLSLGAKVNETCLSYAITHMHKDVEKIVREHICKDT